MQKFRSRKQEWQEFRTHVEEIVATIVESLKLVNVEQTGIREKLEKLKSLVGR